jgi:hypothetical protein
MEGAKKPIPMVGICGFPPIEQKTLDGWGPRTFCIEADSLGVP